MTVSVGILGATGAVGQRLIQLLDAHRQFDIGALTASEDSAGHRYEDVAKWRASGPIPSGVRGMEVVETSPDAVSDRVELLFSSLPSGVAAEVEPEFAREGYVLSSNSSNARLEDDVPLVIPEVNADHLALLDVQRDERGWDGAMVKNPNCSTITLVPPLAVLDQYDLQRVHVSTLQAVSGAGYSGVTSMEIIDNVLPHIGGEEKKMETETCKLLGALDGDTVEWRDINVAASCNRVATLDGHLENVWVETEAEPAPESVEDAMAATEGLDLPSSPDQLITVFEDPNRPQPRLDRNIEGGQGIAVGPVKKKSTGLQFDCLAHNTIRGAAGASVLNGELLVENGYV